MVTSHLHFEEGPITGCGDALRLSGVIASSTRSSIHFAQGNSTLTMATDIVVRILRATEKGENGESRSEDFVVLA